MLSVFLEAGMRPPTPSAVDWVARWIGIIGLVFTALNLGWLVRQSFWRRRAKFDVSLRGTVERLALAVNNAIQRPRAIENLWSARTSADLESLLQTNDLADGKLRRLLKSLHDEVMHGRGHSQPEVDDDYTIPQKPLEALRRALSICDDITDRLDKISRSSE